MANTRVIILEGSNGQSFFLKETLLAEELANQVDPISRADQAIDMIRYAGPYQLVVINLVEAWEQGMKLGFWLSQQPNHCPAILIISPELDHSQFLNGSFFTLSEPLSLRDFAARVRVVLQPSPDNESSNVPIFSNSYGSGLSGWPSDPFHQEYSGYWTPYSQTL